MKARWFAAEVALKRRRAPSSVGVSYWATPYVATARTSKQSQPLPGPGQSGPLTAPGDRNISSATSWSPRSPGSSPRRPPSDRASCHRSRRRRPDRPQASAVLPRTPAARSSSAIAHSLWYDTWPLFRCERDSWPMDIRQRRNPTPGVAKDTVYPWIENRGLPISSHRTTLDVQGLGGG
jgi:hypothetical protein